MTSRRIFLKNGGLALVSLGFAPEFLARTAAAAESRRKVLITIFQRGAVFGLNMLSWWDAEGSLDRVTEPLMADLEAGRLKPILAESFPFSRAGEGRGERRSARHSSVHTSGYISRTWRALSGRTRKPRP